MSKLNPQTIDDLASAYVLGTLTKTERAQVVRLIRNNPEMAQAVNEWQNRLLPLASAVPSAVPPPHVWEAIEAEITAPPAVEKSADLRWLWRWNSAAALVLGAIIGIAVTLLIPGSHTVPESYVGFLAAENSQVPLMHASARRNESVLVVKMIKPQADTIGRVLVLWGLSANSTPHRLGILQSKGKTRITLAAPAEQTFKNVTTLAVSSEPADKPLPPAPAGNIILKGPCVKLW